MPAGDKYENGVNFQTNPILGHLTHIKELDGFRMLRLDCYGVKLFFSFCCPLQYPFPKSPKTSGVGTSKGSDFLQILQGKKLNFRGLETMKKLTAGHCQRKPA